MNKQEAIERIKNLYSFIIEDGPFEVDLINKNQVLDIIYKIDEPQKDVIPKVEQEKLYTVEIPNPKGDSLTVLEKLDDGMVVISQMDVFPVDWRNQAEYQLTEAEIHKDFEWAWQWAKEVE